MKTLSTPALSLARDTHVSRKSHLWAGGTVGVQEGREPPSSRLRTEFGLFPQVVGQTKPVCEMAR